MANVFQLYVLCFYMLFVSTRDDCYDRPLILTPYLESGRIKEAQEAARVVPDIKGLRSYSGFFTVNKECGSNLFFWFFLAENNWKKAPVLLWINGGPGSSSLIGLFDELGPFDYYVNKGLVTNKNRWTKDISVLFVDQPVGTGFSFSEKECYVNTLRIAAKEVYSALVQFFILFPNLRKNKFFLTGESFAGNYIPAIAWEIDQRNNNASTKINLKGFVVGDPYIDITCNYPGPYLYELGIADKSVKKTLTIHERNIVEAIAEGNYKKAYQNIQDLYSTAGDTGLPSVYNVVHETNSGDFEVFVRNYKVRKQIHVGNTPYFVGSDPVYEHLVNFLVLPATKYIQDLLNTNKYIVGFYAGQLDLICQYTSLSCVLRRLDWPGAKEYKAANRTPWYVHGRLAGWYKVAGNLFEVVIRDSGHLVPTDQGLVALDLISAIVSDNPGFKLLSKLKTKP